MRIIERTHKFKRDYKREVKKYSALDAVLLPIIYDLAIDKPLTAKFYDHALIGKWKSYRDCHIKPDLILIYKKVDDGILLLVRLGSHSTLSL